MHRAKPPARAQRSSRQSLQGIQHTHWSYPLHLSLDQCRFLALLCRAGSTLRMTEIDGTSPLPRPSAAPPCAAGIVAVVLVALDVRQDPHRSAAALGPADTCTRGLDDGDTRQHIAPQRRLPPARRPPTPAPVAAQVRLRMIVARHDARSLRAPRTARKATLWLRARRRRTGMGQRPYLGLRTALTLPLLPPPQKNVSLPFDSSPDTLMPGGMSISSSTSPDSGSTLRNSL
jgi:hypothetical protein